jgi:hypothetical protein
MQKCQKGNFGWHMHGSLVFCAGVASCLLPDVAWASAGADMATMPGDTSIGRTVARNASVLLACSCKVAEKLTTKDAKNGDCDAKTTCPCQYFEDAEQSESCLYGL